MPLISVIVPTYNRAQYVVAAVESVLAQTIQDYELIVVDDGSTDNTRQALQRYDHLLTYIYQENQERSSARNAGIRVARGDYLAFLDADDIWLPEKLEVQLAVMNENPSVVLTYCGANYIDARGEPVRYRGSYFNGIDSDVLLIRDLRRELFFGNAVYGGCSTPLIRSDALHSVGDFDLDLRYPEDWDMWLRLSRLGPFAYVPERLVRYRVYGWERALRFDADPSIVEQHLTVLDKALSMWDADEDHGLRLYEKGRAIIFTRAALASLQLGLTDLSEIYLARAIDIDTEMRQRKQLVRTAVDRAHLIQTESGSFEPAVTFIARFFVHLPVSIRFRTISRREAVGKLYIAGSFERLRAGDREGAWHLLRKGLRSLPYLMMNMGVLSLISQIRFGRSPRRLSKLVAPAHNRRERQNHAASQRDYPHVQ